EVAADHDQPRGRIARRPVERPVLQRAQAGFLESLLGTIEIAEIAEQRSDRLGTRRGERGVDPGEVAHFAVAPSSNSVWLASNSLSGRTSKAPPFSSALIRRAASIASSRLAQST